MSAAPSPPPPFRWHVIQCQGTACTERGQLPVARELRNSLFDLGAQDVCRVSRATCLGLCATGPNAVVYATAPVGPAGGTWYSGLTPSAAARIAREHLAGDTPCDDLAFRWQGPSAIL